MKVLILTDRMDMGGAETHIATLARWLWHMGVKVTVASGGGRLADALEREGIPQWRMPLFSHDPLLLLCLRHRLKKAVRSGDFDLLHAHARIPALLIRRCGSWRMPSGKRLRAIITAHAHFRTGVLLPHLCYWGDFTVAVSEDLRRYLLSSYRIPAERISVIENGVDLRQFKPQKTSLHVPSPLGRPCRILFASRLDSDCSLGASLLLSLAPTLCRDFPHLQITLVGGGNAYGNLSFQAKRVNEKLGRSAVSMPGACYDMPTLLGEQDIFVGVSRAAMEAGASGCAVVLCGNEGYFGILSRENARSAFLTNLCARDCPHAGVALLERDLRRLLCDGTALETAKHEARRAIEELANAETSSRATLALYHRLLSPKPCRRILIGGYFGCGNMGDDAILSGLLEALSHAHPEIIPTALTFSPRRDSRRFGIQCYNRKNPISILLALLRADAFLLGGGSLLQDLSSRRSLLYYLALLRTAAFLKRSPMLLSAGIGPLNAESSRQEVASTLALCRYISLRDEVSVRTLTSLGVDAARLHLGADPALFLATRHRLRADAILASHHLDPSGKFLGVTVREGDENLIRHLLPSVLRTLVTRYHITPLFLCLDVKRDWKATVTLMKHAEGVLLSIHEPSDAVAILSVCKATLSMRLHGLILSALASTPALAISVNSDNKLLAFAGQTGQEHLDARTTNAAELVERLEEILLFGKPHRERIADLVAEMRKKAQKDLANIARMVYNIDNEPD